MRGCEILKVGAVSRPQAPNGSLTMWQPPGRPFCFLQHHMSRWFTFARACWISVFSTEQCPLKSCQKVPTVSRVRVAVQVLMSTRWDWTKSPACDERAALMKLKGQRLELNTVNQGDMMRAVMHTRSTRSRASRRQQAGQSCHGLKKPLRPSEVFFSSLQFSSS